MLPRSLDAFGDCRDRTGNGYRESCRIVSTFRRRPSICWSLRRSGGNHACEFGSVLV
jgi:hypothetical protein